MAFDKLVDPDLIDGTIAELGHDELLLHKDPANDLGADGRFDGGRDVPERRRRRR